jgi:hypothetical protein
MSISVTVSPKPGKQLDKILLEKKNIKALIVIHM